MRLAGGREGGSIMLVLALLLALGLLSALWLTVSAAEQLIAAARRAEHRRHYAAEGAMEEVLAALAVPGQDDIPAESLREGTPAFTTEEQGGSFAGMKYRWRARFVPDRHDRDGDPGTGTVLFSHAFGYDGSPFAAGGYPVVRVALGLSDGAGATAMQADVTPVVLNPAVAAAWTGGGELLFERSVLLSGNDHDGEGVPVAGDPVPAVLSSGRIHLAAGAFAESAAGDPVREEVPDALPGDPLALLAGGETLRCLSALPPPPEDGRCLQGIYATDRDYCGALCGSGTLVVHNPRFDPVRYEASRLFLEEGVATEGLDPSYSHLDPEHQPASVTVYRGGAFRGLVVADTVAFVYDPTRIIGAVVTLSRSPTAVTGDRSLEVRYSRSALHEAGLGPLSHRLGVWHPGGGAEFLREE